MQSGTTLSSSMSFLMIMDFGYPQNLSPEILKLYITQEGVGSPFSSKVSPISMMSIHSIFTNGTEMPFL
jgi:hypothetical protein